MSDTSQALSAGQWLDRLYGTALVQRQVEQAHPDETLIYLSGAMFIPKNERDDSMQRITMTAKRGAFVATSERLVFETAMFMPMNVLFMAGALGSFILWGFGGGFPAVMLAALATASLIRRRPYRVELTRETTAEIVLHAITGPTGDYHSIIIHGVDASYQVVTTAPIPPHIQTFFEVFPQFQSTTQGE